MDDLGGGESEGNYVDEVCWGKILMGMMDGIGWVGGW
jgi:hypothetical protein